MRKNILIVAALVTVFACKKTETAPPAPSTATAATTTAPAPQPTATTASVAPAAGAVAATDGETGGTHIDVTEFKRSSGNTVSLKFVLSNNGSEKFDMWGYKLGDRESKSDYKGVGGIHLVDPVNKKKYFVVRDSEGKCVCSNEVADVQPGSRVNLWAKLTCQLNDPRDVLMDDVTIAQ